jgi:hypothetical protein
VSALPPKADAKANDWRVRFGPEADKPNFWKGRTQTTVVSSAGAFDDVHHDAALSNAGRLLFGLLYGGFPESRNKI